MLLEDHLVRAQEPAGAAVGVGVPRRPAADLGTEDLEALGLGDPAAHRGVPGDDGHAPQHDPCRLVLRVHLDVLTHLGVAGGGEGALLAPPAEADVVLQLVLAGSGKATELADELLLLLLWWWNWLGLLLLILLLLLLLLDLLLLLLLWWRWLGLLLG